MVNQAFGAKGAFGKRSSETKAEEKKRLSQERILAETAETLKEFDEAGRQNPNLAYLQDFIKADAPPAPNGNSGEVDSTPPAALPSAPAPAAAPAPVVQATAPGGADSTAERPKGDLDKSLFSSKPLKPKEKPSAPADGEDGKICRFAAGGDNFRIDMPFSVKDGLTDLRQKMLRRDSIKTQLRDMMIIGAYQVLHMKPEDYMKAFEAAQKFIREQEG